MFKNLIKISKKDMTREEWVESRKGAIGGSDAAAIIGLNEWSSPFSVWADKLGKVEPKEQNEAMRQGSDLEEYVVKRFTEQTGKRCKQSNFIFKNPDYPFAHANVDRLIIGEDAGLECKTTSEMNLHKFKSGEFPANYYVQCVHYMMVTGCKKWYLAVLVYSRGFYVFEINRDEDEIKALAESEQTFWHYVESNEQPPIDGTEATKNALGAVYDETTPTLIDLNPYAAAIKELDELKEKKKEIETSITAKENSIKAFMMDAEAGEWNNYKITWKQQAGRKTFDVDRLASDYPDIDLGNYYNVGKPLRVFRMTKKGDKKQ